MSMQMHFPGRCRSGFPAALYRLLGRSRARPAIVSWMVRGTRSTSAIVAWRDWSAAWPRAYPGRAALVAGAGLGTCEPAGSLRRIAGYTAAPEIRGVSFSYLRREPLGSTSLVYGESHLVDLDREGLLAALAEIGPLRKRLRVLNPRPSLAEVARYVRGEQQSVPCIGGYKYFHLDWNLDIWRCEAWTGGADSADGGRHTQPSRRGVESGADRDFSVLAGALFAGVHSHTA